MTDSFLYCNVTLKRARLVNAIAIKYEDFPSFSHISIIIIFCSHTSTLILPFLGGESAERSSKYGHFDEREKIINKTIEKGRK